MRLSRRAGTSTAISPFKIAALAAIFIWVLAACGAPTPTAVSAANIPLETVIVPTLPPTWTPTFTPTPLPPSTTPTATPVPSATATLSPAALCEKLLTTGNLRDGRIFAWDDLITLLVNTPAADVPARFWLVHRPTDQNRGVQLPGGQLTGIQLAAKALFGPGEYQWTLSLHDEANGDLCQQSGIFIVAGRESTRAEERHTR